MSVETEREHGKKNNEGKRQSKTYDEKEHKHSLCTYLIQSVFIHLSNSVFFKIPAPLQHAIQQASGPLKAWQVLTVSERAASSLLSHQPGFTKMQ